MIKKFSELQEGDKFLFIDTKKEAYLFEMISRTEKGSIRALRAKAKHKQADYAFGRTWQVDCNPDKSISVYARAK